MTDALTLENYQSGFLVGDDTIAGVTELSHNVIAAYVSRASTGETLEYQEFSSAEIALSYLNARTKGWKYEAVGCNTSSKSSCQNSSCSGCSCS